MENSILERYDKKSTFIKKIFMTQRDMAGYIGVTPVTLRNWRKEKPKLYEIVMKGFAFEEVVKKIQQNADELKALKEQVKSKK